MNVIHKTAKTALCGALFLSALTVAGSALAGSQGRKNTTAVLGALTATQILKGNTKNAILAGAGTLVAYERYRDAKDREDRHDHWRDRRDRDRRDRDRWERDRRDRERRIQEARRREEARRHREIELRRLEAERRARELERRRHDHRDDHRRDDHHDRWDDRYHR
jgi:hypothetical protein